MRPNLGGALHGLFPDRRYSLRVQVFSFIGIAMGTGCIAGPALGGYLADPALRAMLPRDSPLGAPLAHHAAHRRVRAVACSG